MSILCKIFSIYLSISIIWHILKIVEIDKNIIINTYLKKTTKPTNIENNQILSSELEFVVLKHDLNFVLLKIQEYTEIKKIRFAANSWLVIIVCGLSHDESMSKIKINNFNENGQCTHYIIAIMLKLLLLFFTFMCLSQKKLYN